MKHCDIHTIYIWLLLLPVLGRMDYFHFFFQLCSLNISSGVWQFVLVRPNLGTKNNFCIKIYASWNSSWNSFPLKYVLKVVKCILQQHIKAYHFYPNQLDLDTRYRTGHSFKQHHRPTTAHTSSKHVSSASFTSFSFLPYRCNTALSLVCPYCLCSLNIHHSKIIYLPQTGQLIPQINHYKSNVFNLHLEP